MSLLGSLLGRLDSDPKARTEGWDVLVLAVLDGLEALDAELEQAAPSKRPSPQAKAEREAPVGAYLRAITVEGFRGVGREVTLGLPPGPGLVLVVGRNGSGKSSFAEALELLLTGDTFRWAQRTRVWRDGWRNLHHAQARIRAEFTLEGERGPCVIDRQWDEEADWDDAATSAQIHGKPKADLDTLGWKDALETYRPFLSYNELGSMLDEGPSKLYDALSAILGVEALSDAQALLQQARASREKELKSATAIHDQVIETLAQVRDQRAAAVATALSEKDWALDRVEGILGGDDAAAGEDGVLQSLRALAALAGPAPDAVTNAAVAVRAAGERLRAASDAVAARSRDLADLLDHALRFHERHGDGDCPVCGRKGALSAAWHKGKAQEAAELRDAARDVEAAQKQMADVRNQVQKLPTPRTELLDKAAGLGLSAEAVRAALDAWSSGLATIDADALAAHLQCTGPPLWSAIEELRRAAGAEAGKREDAWRPLARQLATWLPIARTALEQAKAIPRLKKAEEWFKRTGESIRNERFGPIAEQSIQIWTQLRLHSNVTLGRITLESSGKRRHVELHVQVDGVEGAALGVMSQGELHCLALSLFIPRATLAESPFRFIVIDDPVQSMDPARVDGLARVLDATARERQVVVFTHDDRLPEAVRRLGISAHTIEVTRREGSVVQLRPGKGPVDRNIEDALALAFTDALPPQAARRVIPGFCRSALEAACTEAVRRRRLAKGEAHAEVAALIDAAGKLSSRVSLAIFDDPRKEGEVLGRLNRERRDWADVYRWCNEGTHEEQPGPMVDRIRESERLAKWLQAL